MVDDSPPARTVALDPSQTPDLATAHARLAEMDRAAQAQAVPLATQSGGYAPPPQARATQRGGYAPPPPMRATDSGAYPPPPPSRSSVAGAPPPPPRGSAYPVALDSTGMTAVSPHALPAAAVALAAIAPRAATQAQGAQAAAPAGMYAPTSAAARSGAPNAGAPNAGAPNAGAPNAGAATKRTEESSDAHLVALKPGLVVGGRSRVEQIIGRGGMGSVYAVSHVNTGEALALKLLHPALADNAATVERFRTEARAPVRIASEHVVRVVDADVCAQLSVPFIVMERLEGHDIRSELKRRGAIPAGEVVLYLRQVARALDKAHQKGIVHRDLKPANLYLVRREDGSPLVKVLDFGIAKLTDEASQELTVAGQVFGTPWYMAPEQARGEATLVGPATDRWALGLIAFQLLTGRNYWTADGMAGLIGQICYEPMRPPTQLAPHLGPLFDMWFARACHRTPSERFPTSGEMIDDLAGALGVSVAGVTTGSHSVRNADASMQLQIQMTPSGRLSIPGAIGGASSSGANVAIDGTTNAPLQVTQLPGPPAKRKSQSAMAVMLGVVGACLVAAAGAGIYLISRGATANSAATAATSPTDATPAASDAASPEAKEEPPATTATATATAAEPASSAAASASASPEPPSATSATPSLAASASAPATAAAPGGASGKPSQGAAGATTNGPATGGPATGGPATGGPATGGPATGGPATGGPAKKPNKAGPPKVNRVRF